MAPKEKAKELVNKFIEYTDQNSYTELSGYENAKQCALVAVNEIIDTCEINLVESYNTDWWNKVKNEIDKL